MMEHRDRIDSLRDGAGLLTQSYVHGVSTVPLLGETVGAVFDKTAARCGEAEALVACHQGIRWDWHGLKARVDACAAGLLALGLQPGDRIGIWAPNGAEWVVTQFAAARAGLVLVGIDPSCRREALAYALNRVRCRALVTAAAFEEIDYIGMIRALMPEVDAAAAGALYAGAVPDLRLLIRLGDEKSPGMFNFEDLYHLGGAAEECRLAHLAHVVQFDDPVSIQFTGGTTGRPGAATWTHHNLVNNALFTGMNMGLTERDRLCIPVPLYRGFGMGAGVVACAVHGATMVFPSAGCEVGAMLDAVEREVCTALLGDPDLFVAALEALEADPHDMSSLRTGIMAGVPCTIERMRRVVDQMQLDEITVAYGTAEAGPVLFQTRYDDVLERRATTVGRVLPHTEVKIVDAEGRIVPPGTPGALCARGFGVMRGYWHDPGHTAEVVDAAGWMHSDAAAVLDEEGYATILGRMKDAANRDDEHRLAERTGEPEGTRAT